MNTTRQPNIVLLVADSLRADHLGCYGYTRATSPTIDRLAETGTLSERMLCAGIPTQPSFTTLYTGQHPIRHRIVSHGGSVELCEDTPVLPEVLLAAGYETCAVDSLWRERHWLGRGFEFYIDPSIRHHLPLLVTAEEINQRVIEWIQIRRKKPFFVMAHYWDTHYPYLPPRHLTDLFYRGNRVDPRNRSLDDTWRQAIPAIARETWLRTPEGCVTDVEYVRALYDGAIRYFDERLADMIKCLDRFSAPENTLLIVTGDHGESIDEHGIYMEHFGLYDCTLRVPFLLRWPGLIPPGRRIPHLLDNSRIAATVLEAAGIPAPQTMNGKTFWKLLTGEVGTADQRSVFSVECSWQAKWSLTTDEYRFILGRGPDVLGNPGRELYDLRTDPGETTNIAECNSEVAESMESTLEDWISARLHEYGYKRDPVLEQGISLSEVRSVG